jgi:hypothetical protein
VIKKASKSISDETVTDLHGKSSVPSELSK